MKGLCSRIPLLFAAAGMLAGCVVGPGPDPYYGEEAPPPLPSVVELDSGPYYHYRDYHYRYENDRWHYARHREGPWHELPRSHWPHEVRQRGEAGRGPAYEHERR
ncbi:hypothetical protein GMST_06810 [Geomonas silvestris]|uniref:Lipoprotein n=1 Tax=Geomonas silvestris TaxID=2740184 RepID=A0A6V8MED9_9BACT|nr:hypothetical protein [Geomonas silvestris]GFO58356.1 hypothetical protein GMST_06810 [Geomonas silvestris]